MTVTVEQVLRDAGAGTEDTDLAQESLDQANAYVDAYVDAALIDAMNPVPAPVRDAGVLTCATDLFARSKAPFGQQIVTDSSGTPVATRLGIDPLAGVRAKFRPWCMNAGFSYPADWATT